MNWPETREEFIDYFMTHPGMKYSQDDLEFLADNLFEKPYYYTYYPYQIMSDWGRITNYVFDIGLMDQSQQKGWVDINGKFYGCAYACHEHFVSILGHSSRYHMETLGYIHVSGSRTPEPIYFSMYRVNAKQRRTLKKLGCYIDNATELTKPFK